jgi:hypothetical protein
MVTMGQELHGQMRDVNADPVPAAEEPDSLSHGTRDDMI